jgi:hypothetical protein
MGWDLTPPESKLLKMTIKIAFKKLIKCVELRNLRPGSPFLANGI